MESNTVNGSSNNVTLTFAMVSVAKWCQLKNIPHDHGLEHIHAVLEHGHLAVADLPENIQLPILLAIAGHDLDDHKYVSSTDYEGARQMLAECDQTDPKLVELVITMIKLVSCSQNGNSVDPDLPYWYYIPRLCDRLEAIGCIGIRRAYETNGEFNKRGKQIPFWTNETARCKTVEEIEKWANPDRLQKYISRGGVSDSLIDHFADKLLHICKLTPSVGSLQEIANNRRQVMIDFLLEFGQTGTIDWTKWLFRVD